MSVGQKYWCLTAYCFFFEIAEFTFLRFCRFLIVFQGSDLSRKLREATSCNLAPVRSKFDLVVPTYEDLTEKTFFEILNPSFSTLVEEICYFWLQNRIRHAKSLPGITSRGLETGNLRQLSKNQFSKQFTFKPVRGLMSLLVFTRFLQGFYQVFIKLFYQVFTMFVLLCVYRFF